MRGRPLRRGRTDSWVCLDRIINNVLDASLNLYNHQNKSFDGFTGQEMHLGHISLLTLTGSM